MFEFEFELSKPETSPHESDAETENHTPPQQEVVEVKESKDAVETIESNTPKTFAEIVKAATEILATELETAVTHSNEPVNTKDPKGESSPNTPRKGFLTLSAGRRSPGYTISPDSDNFFTNLPTMIAQVKQNWLAKKDMDVDEDKVEKVAALTSDFLKKIHLVLSTSLKNMGRKSSPHRTLGVQLAFNQRSRY